MAGGSGKFLRRSKEFVLQTGNEIVLIYKPAATCLSTAAIPCRLTLTAPDGYVVQSAGSFYSSNTVVYATPTGFGSLSLNAAPVCDQITRSCVFESKPGTALWANVQYGLQITVRNPTSPLAQARRRRWR